MSIARRAIALGFAICVLVSCTQNTQDEGDATASPSRTAAVEPTGSPRLDVQEFDVPAGSRPHDVAPAAEGGGVWYTAQGSGELGLLDPSDGTTKHIDLGAGSAPHGVIVGPDGAPWITDGGLNAIVRVDPKTDDVETFPLPDDRPDANLNTATFDGEGDLWFTGQAGIYGRLDLPEERIEVFDAPGGRGPYGIDTTLGGEVMYASLAGSHIAHIDVKTGRARRIDPPTTDQGARRIWHDTQGNMWVSEWNVGKLGRYFHGDGSWKEYDLPGDNPMAYAVYVHDHNIVWVSDFGGNALQRFDPETERFTTIPLPSDGANVRQILGRPGEVWGAESGVDKLVVVRTG